jgi:hypothetical protein
LLDLSVGIALRSAAQIALFVAAVLVLLSYVPGPTPMNLQFFAGSRRDDVVRDDDGVPGFRTAAGPRGSSGCR